MSLTLEEVERLYKAAELIETDTHEFSCHAILGRDSSDVDKLLRKYAKFYSLKPNKYGGYEVPFETGSLRSEDKLQRIIMILLFAEVGGL